MGLLESPLGMRWTTLLTALLMVFLVGVIRRRPDLAGVAVVAWAGGFEVVYRFWDIVRWQEWWAWSSWFWEAAALAGWVFLAQSVGIRPSLFWLAATLLCFAIWISTGYRYNYVGQKAPFQVLGEIENVSAKTAWAMAYLVGAWRVRTPPPWRRWQRTPPPAGVEPHRQEVAEHGLRR